MVTWLLLKRLPDFTVPDRPTANDTLFSALSTVFPEKLVYSAKLTPMPQSRNTLPATRHFASEAPALRTRRPYPVALLQLRMLSAMRQSVSVAPAVTSMPHFVVIPVMSSPRMMFPDIEHWSRFPVRIPAAVMPSRPAMWLFVTATPTHLRPAVTSALSDSSAMPTGVAAFHARMLRMTLSVTRPLLPWNTIAWYDTIAPF